MRHPDKSILSPRFKLRHHRDERSGDGSGPTLPPQRRDLSMGTRPFRRERGRIEHALFSLEGIEIVVFAYILVFLCDRYACGSEQLPVLVGPQGD
jgi:hypothetical protein